MTAFAVPLVGVGERPENRLKTAPGSEMTLKDWFAGQFMAAMLGSDPSYSSQRDSNGQLCKMDQTKLANMAKSAYQAAEALMQVRAAE